MGAGDLDSDGAVDFLISAPLANAGGSQPGRVYLISGNIRRLVRGDADGDGEFNGLADA